MLVSIVTSVICTQGSLFSSCWSLSIVEEDDIVVCCLLLVVIESGGCRAEK